MKFTQLIFILILTLSGYVVASPDVEQKILSRITQSQSELQNLQKKMMQESAVYSDNLNRSQRELEALREKAAVIRRQKDEQLLSLEQIKNRVDQWSSQSNYQKSLITNYLEANKLMSFQSGDVDVEPDALEMVSSDIEKKLNPTWSDIDLVVPSGEILKSQMLVLGPVKLAVDSEKNLAGIVSASDKEAELNFEYSSKQKNGFIDLQSNGVGDISFDPTLGKAFELRSQDGNLINHIQKGGAWAIPIVIFGVVSLIISLIKGLEFIRLPKLDKSLADDLIQVETSGSQNQFEIKNKIANAALPQKALLEIARTTRASQQRDDLMVAYLMAHKHKVEKFMGVVSISAAIAPLLGLLGTVSGMISTFKMMTIFGTGDASTVSGGISIALITTELGLIVAIPSLVASALLSRKVKSYTHELENFAIKISKIDFK